MENIYILPDLFFQKIKESPVLKDVFASMSKESFMKMMTCLILHFTVDNEISQDLRLHLSHIHSDLKIKRHQYASFIDLLVNTCQEIGMAPKDILFLKKALRELDYLFVYNEDEFKFRVLQKLDDIQKDLECHEDFKDISLLIDMVKTRVENKKNARRLSNESSRTGICPWHLSGIGGSAGGSPVASELLEQYHTLSLK